MKQSSAIYPQALLLLLLLLPLLLLLLLPLLLLMLQQHDYAAKRVIQTSQTPH